MIVNMISGIKMTVCLFHLFISMCAAVSISFRERELRVKESQRTVEVCVRLSNQIARHLAFHLTTRNGTAKGKDLKTDHDVCCKT